MEKYLDQSLTAKERAMDLLSRMSPEEKMAQVGCVLIPAGREKEAMAYCKYGIGEVSTLEGRMMEETKNAACTGPSSGVSLPEYAPACARLTRSP